MDFVPFLFMRIGSLYSNLTQTHSILQKKYRSAQHFSPYQQSLWQPINYKCQEKQVMNSSFDLPVGANRTIQAEIIHRTFMEKIWNCIIHIVRFFHLLLIFIPPMLLSPLLLFQRGRSYWMDCFVKAIERAGVVWIKAFQYLSHRRDIIGPEMAEKFIHLRENAPTHSFEETKKNFKITYGKKIEQIFQQFDPIPLASGSVSQVYKAKYQGKKVAVKVRHPGVDKYIERDINLLFFFSYLCSFISPSMQIPISQTSLKRTLTQQIDFNNQKINLDIFNHMFKEREQIKFPIPFAENSKDSVLVETFVEGIPITYYEKNSHPLNKVIARLGSTTFFEMLMKNNFIHADCHGGNILVQIISNPPNIFTKISDAFTQFLIGIEAWLKSCTFENEILKRLYNENKIDEKKVRQLLRKYKQKVVVTLIDVGMVISLNQIDKSNFVNFIKSVIEGKGQQCAQMIYNLSNFEGKKITIGQFQAYYLKLKELFSILDHQKLDDLNGMILLSGMLTIIRENSMKLDGQFATLLTNMMVLQAMAKDIDPEINILKCAIPYFQYV